jgi:hypothetical protein
LRERERASHAAEEGENATEGTSRNIKQTEGSRASALHIAAVTLTQDIKRNTVIAKEAFQRSGTLAEEETPSISLDMRATPTSKSAVSNDENTRN